MAKIGRNRPCPCGSGKKHKKCCGAPRETSTEATSALVPKHPSSPPRVVVEAEPAASNQPGEQEIRCFDSTTAAELHHELQRSLADTAKRFGLALELGGFSYSSRTARMRIELSTIREDGMVMNREAEDFLLRCREYDLEPAMLGAVFHYNGRTVRVIGLNARRKQPIICEQLDPKEDPKPRICYAVEIIRHVLVERPDGHQPPPPRRPEPRPPSWGA